MGPWWGPRTNACPLVGQSRSWGYGYSQTEMRPGISDCQTQDPRLVSAHWRVRLGSQGGLQQSLYWQVRLCPTRPSQLLGLGHLKSFADQLVGLTVYQAQVIFLNHVIFGQVQEKHLTKSNIHPYKNSQQNYEQRKFPQMDKYHLQKTYSYSSAGKESAYNAGDSSSIPRSRRSTGERIDYHTSILRLPCGSADKRICLQHRRFEFDPWVGKIP